MNLNNSQDLDLGIFYNQQGILTDLSVLIWDKSITDKNRKLYNSFILNIIINVLMIIYVFMI